MPTFRIIKYLFFFILIFCPLFFLTDTTRNPYLIQIVLLENITSLILILWIISHTFLRTIPAKGGSLHDRKPTPQMERYPEKVWEKKDLGDLLLGIFLGVCLVSATISIIIHPEWRFSIRVFSFKGMRFLFVNCILVYYITRFLVANEEGNFKRIIYITIFVSTISSLYAILQYVDIEPFWKTGVVSLGPRSVSTFGNPNFMASFLILTISLLGGLSLAEKNLFRKSLFFIMLLVNVIGLVTTGTRSAWLGIGCSIILLFIFSLKYYPQTVKRTVFFIFLIILLSLIPLRRDKDKNVFMTVTNRISSIVNFQSQAYQQRILIWRSAIDIFKDYPILGCGWGSFEIFYPFYQSKYLTTRRYSPFRTHANNVHNIFLEVLSQSGIIGFITFILFLFFFIKKLFRNCILMKDEMRIIGLSIFCGTIGFLLDNLLNVTLFFATPALLFWTYCGLISCYGEGRNRQKNE